jgi:hypothetical protein
MSNGFNWNEEVDKVRQQPAMPLREPAIPQAPEADTTVEGLIEQARAGMSRVWPAATVAERFGAEPGADIGTPARRHPPAEREPSVLDLTPQEQAEVVRLGTQAGMFGPGSERGRGAQDHAALVADLLKSGAWTTSEDGTPGRRVTRTKITGHTFGNGSGQ